jgi:hypothetical protein
MTKEEVYNWVFENFDIVKDPDATYIYDLVPKTDIGRMLDEDFRNRSGLKYGFYMNRVGSVNGDEIENFLHKFYNVSSETVKYTFRQIVKSLPI